MRIEEQKHWFAVQVAPRREKRVAALLEYKGYEQFLPTCKLRRKWSDRTKVIENPLFPGYVFCRTQSEGVGLVGTTPGIMRILGFGGKPYPISDAEIVSIQKAVSSGVELSPCPHFELGQTVQVTKGPLAGVRGLLAQVKKNQGQLVLSINLIQKSISIEIAVSDVMGLGAAA